MPYKLGRKSLANLVGVHDDLRAVVISAITLSEQDFSAHEGLRSAERQQKLFERGASTLDGVTRKSRHQSGHAVDLVPYIDGGLRWEWELFFPICDAVKAAAEELSIPIRWGGTWQEITDNRYSGMSAKQMYDLNPSWDGAHFELPKRVYPT